MAAQGAFAALGPGARVEAAHYVKFGNGEAARTIALDWKNDPPFAEVVAEHRSESSRCSTPSRTPRPATWRGPFPKYASRFGGYDHLSRVKEWSATGGVDDSAGGEE